MRTDIFFPATTVLTRIAIGVGLVASLAACGGGSTADSASTAAVSSGPLQTAAMTATGTAAAAATTTWSNCSLEGATCSFTGTKQVRYGANGTYAYKTLAGPVACTNEVFGDPLPGADKTCAVSDSTGTTTAPTATPTPTPTKTLNNLYVSAARGLDSNAGTSSAPFRTIQRAANLAKPGSTIHVGPGTYTETITSSVNGTASARIRFVSDSKWQAIIKPTSSTTRTIWTAKGGYTDIDGFQVDGTVGKTVRIGIYLNGGNSSVRNSWVHHVAQNSGCDNRGGAGLLADQGRGKAYGNYEFTGNLVHNIGTNCGWIQGIYHSSNGKIMNNVVYGTFSGINMGHDDHNILVMNNTLFGNGGYGVYFGGCKESYNNGCPTSGIQIHNNVIYANGGGIQGPIPSEDVGNSVSNNLVYANKINYSLAATGSANKSKAGMITADPQFVKYIAGGGGDYRLKSTSPAIGKGQLANAPAVDIDGKPRGARIDMGAYETNLN